MSKIIISGRGGSGKSTLVSLLTKKLGEQGKKVLVVDTDESNLGLGKMLGQEPAAMTFMGCMGGKPAVREKLLVSLKKGNDEKVSFLKEDLNLNNLPSECVSGEWPILYMRIGKIEHSMEGCACPMGALARSFLKKLTVGENEWVLIDTEAGVEHFGRGVLEGADLVVMVVDPTQEALLLAERAKMLAAEVNKEFVTVLNKVDEKTEPFLRRELSAAGIPILGALNFSAEINQANLVGEPLFTTNMQDKLEELVNGLSRLSGKT